MRLPILRKLTSWIKNWWWSGFAFFLTMLWMGSFIFGIIQNTHFTMLERFACSVDILGLLALWGLGLQKRIFQQFFWQLFIFIKASLLILYMVFSKNYDLPLLWWIMIFFVDAIVTLPYYIGLFIYAFCSRQIWEGVEHKPVATYGKLPIYKCQRKEQRYKKCLVGLKLSAKVTLIILCLILIPLIISNNRIIVPHANPSEYYEHMLKYRRTTIPELKEFESLFPNYLCEFTYENPVKLKPDSIGYFNLEDPNTSVKWSLIAGLYKRYLFIMETDIVYGKIEPETGKILLPGSHEEPTFILYEVSGSVSVPFALFHPRCPQVSYHSIKVFDSNDWKHLVEAKGDFSALGIQLNRNAPILNFELAFRNND